MRKTATESTIIICFVGFIATWSEIKWVEELDYATTNFRKEIYCT